MAAMPSSALDTWMPNRLLRSISGITSFSRMKTEEINWKKNGKIKIKYPVVLFRVRISSHAYVRETAKAMTERISNILVMGGCCRIIVR